MSNALARQLRKPSGFFGKLVTKLMEFRNRESYGKIIEKLSPVAGEHIMEIGYGPGLGVYQIASSVPDCRISGIDYSEQMYHKASGRNAKFIQKGTVQLKYGDFLTFETGNDPFDKIFCVNVIYFWNDLNLAFTKVYGMLAGKGEFLIYMDHRDSLEKAKFLSDFCKYSIGEVESELKNAGFVDIEYTFNRGYFITAKKSGGYR